MKRAFRNINTQGDDYGQYTCPPSRQAYDAFENRQF